MTFVKLARLSKDIEIQTIEQKLRISKKRYGKFESGRDLLSQEEKQKLAKFLEIDQRFLHADVKVGDCTVSLNIKPMQLAVGKTEEKRRRTQIGMEREEAPSPL